jgi:hypothetical protein
VTYTSAATSGSIRFTPVANGSGSAVITLVVEDGGGDGDLSTTGDNLTETRTFTVTVAAVNDSPTLDAPSNLGINEDASEQTVNLSGISAGGGETQPLRVTASSNNTALIPNPAVTYTSANAIGSIRFTPVTDLSGTATIEVFVEDGGLDGDLSTPGDNLSVSHSFVVTVAAVNDEPTIGNLTDLQLSQNASEQIVNLVGISAGGGESQPLSVTASSSNTGLIANPDVTYTSADATGSIRFTPIAGASGSAVITVTVTDGGLDADLSTPADNETFSATFTVVVNDPPSLDSITDVTVSEDAPEQSVSLTGISAGPSEAQTIRISAASGNTTLIANPAITYTSPNATATLNFTPTADLSGTALITVTLEDAGFDGDFATTADNRSSTTTFTITVTAVNDAPTLDSIPNSTISEDASEQTVNLSGISAGGGESQPLLVTASSNNTTLIPDPTVTYTSPAVSGSIRYTPVANLSGTATITVTVMDGGLDGDLSTPSDNQIYNRTFDVTVTAVNDLPTLDALTDLTISEDSAEQTVNLAGITAGGGESQPLKVTATSSSTLLIPTPTVTYTSADLTGSIQFTPVADQSGLATITVFVEDGGPDADLSTTTDNAIFSRSFVVTVSAVNDQPTLNPLSDETIAEDAAEQTVSLSGISAGGGESQVLRVTATSSNTTLIPAPSVTYESPNAIGSIKYTPAADQNGTATITVTVEDSGPDNDLSTSTDNLTYSRTFTVTVNPVNDAPTINNPGNQTIDEDAAEQTLSLTGITAGGGESQPLRLTVSSSNTGLIPTPALFYTSADSTGSIKFTPTAELNGVSTITIVVEDGGSDLDLSTTSDNLSTTINFDLTVQAVNDAPTLDFLYDLTIAEDSSEHTVDLSGITAGSDESQTLRIFATSSDSSVVPNPTAVYTSAASTGSIKLQSAPDRHGVITIIVTVEDAGLDGDINTKGDNGYSNQSFQLTVAPNNDAPDFDQPVNLTLSEDATEQTINLTGITAGPWESQPLSITVSSNNTGLIPTPSLTYTTPDASGTLKFTPVPNQSGVAEISITLEDGGDDGKLQTAGDNLKVTKTFTVTVDAVNDDPTLDDLYDMTISEDDAEQIIDLSGIGAGGGENQPLRVTASSSGTSLIPDPTVVYMSADMAGTLKFTPVANQSGTAVITVYVEDGGLDNDLSTPGDNGKISKSFSVTVTPVNDLPTIVKPADVTLAEDASEQIIGLTGITAGGGENQPLQVTASSSNTGLIPDPTVIYTSADTIGSLKFTPVVNQSGTAVITIVVVDGGLDSNLATTTDNITITTNFTVTVNAVNDAPTIDTPAEMTIDEDSPEQNVSLTGITAGGGESQPLKITASSNNSALIPGLTVVYTSANATGSLQFTPTADLSGSATITLEVEDGGLDTDLSTPSDNSKTTVTFTINVTQLNDEPTLDDLYDGSVSEDASEQVIDLTGITAGGGESQPLRVTASSNNTDLIPNPTVVYTSADSMGSLTFTPIADQTGVARITVLVEDGGVDGDLSTDGDNQTVTKSFLITVIPENDIPTLDDIVGITIDEDAPEQIIALSGISAGGGESQPLSITVSSSNTLLIPTPDVIYVSADATGSLKFTPVANQSGSAQIMVRLEDGGLDGMLSTEGDNLTVIKTFTVTVNPVNDLPTIDQPAQITIAEDAAEQTVILTGISAGGGETQPLRVTASSSDVNLIPNPNVDYTSPDSIGLLMFTPVANQSGLVEITIYIEDSGDDGDFSTINDNAISSTKLIVTVLPVNDLPTIDQPGDLAISEDAAEQLVSLSGITAGGGESQPLMVTASSSNIALIPDPAVIYSSDNATGSLTFTPVADQSGVAVITIMVKDGGLDGDLSTPDDNLLIQTTFTVTVAAVNDAPGINTPANIAVDEDSQEQIVGLTGITAGGGENQPLKVTATSSNSALIPDPTVVYTSSETTGTLNFTPAANLSGSALITLLVEDAGLDGDLSTPGDNSSTMVMFTITVNAVNDSPTLDALNDFTISEDSAEQTVDLAGITAGGGESQPLKVTATSGNTALIPNLTVIYTSADASGSLKFTPVADQSGTSTITVFVEDGGMDGDLSTSGDNLSVSRSFTVTVTAVNDAPTLDQPANITISEDAAEQTVSLTGIFAGGGESQPLKITASSSHTSLIANPTIVYTSASSTGLLTFTPTADLSGAAIITVRVEDGGLDGDFSTAEDNLTVTRSFTVTVNAVNDQPTLDELSDVTISEDAAEQTVSLTGILAGGGEIQPLKVTASSSNAGLIPTPTVLYTSADSTGSLRFTPVANQSGSAVITVIVEDGGADADLGTGGDNLTVTRTFAITVTAVNDDPTMDQPANVTVDEDAAEQVIGLTGIAAGGGESQPLKLTISSGNPAVIPTPSVVYTSASSTGQIRFTPAADQSGVVTLTATVEDGGLDGDLSTAGDNNSHSRTFTVTVNPVNDAPTLDSLADRTISEDASEQTVNLSGIMAGGGESQPLRVTAVSSNTALIPAVNVTYVSADSIGTLTFTPTSRTTGVSQITVTVEDGGFDQDLSTASDNQTFSRTFTVTVQAIRPVILSPIGSTPAQRPLFVWTAVPGAVSYKVWVGNASTDQRPLFVATSVSTQYQMPTDLGIGKFELYVQAMYVDGGTGAWSEISRFNVVTSVIVSPLTSRQTTPRPTLRWTAIPGAVQYNIWLDNRSTGQTPVYSQSVTTTQWTPDADLPLSRYRFWARGVAIDGTTAGWSVPTDFLVVTSPQPLSPLTATFSRQPTFTWTTVLGATSYGFYLQSLSTGAVVANVSGLSTPRFTPAAPLSIGNYAWWAIAESTTAGFRSDWSPRTEIFVGGRPTITGPTGTVATLRPTISWTSVLGAATYDVWVNRTFGNQITTNVFKILGVSGTSVQVPSDLVNGASYRVWLRAVSTTGEISFWSNPVDFSVSLQLAQNSLPQSEDSGSLQLLSAESLLVQVPQLALLPVAEVQPTKHSRIRVSRPLNEQQDIEQAAVAVAAPVSAPAPTANAAQPADTMELEAEADQSIQEIVDALLAGGLKLS